MTETSWIWVFTTFMAIVGGHREKAKLDGDDDGDEEIPKLRTIYNDNARPSFDFCH